MKRGLTRLATTAIPMRDFFTMPHPYSKEVDRKDAVKGSRERVRRLAKYFVAAWQQKVDIVVGYESITGAGRFALNPETRDVFDALLETVPGPTTEFVGGLARKHRGCCAICLHERDGKKVYNTAVLIDRKGKVAGKYRKVHLPPQERIYTDPGNDFPVFDADFGKVGFSICYDGMFPETARGAAMGGADLLIHIGNTSYTLQEETLRVRAADNQIWLLACNHVEGISTIVDPMGNTVARATRYSPGFVWADVDLNMERPMPLDNTLSGVSSLRGRMCQERVPAAYRVLTLKEPPLRRRYRGDPIPRTRKQFDAVISAAVTSLRHDGAVWDARRQALRHPGPK